MKLPITFRGLADALKEVSKEADQEVRLVIVGRVGTGKSHIGAWLLKDNPSLARQVLKSISLVNVDSAKSDMITAFAEATLASLVLLVVDASAQDHKKESLLFKGLERVGKPVLVVLNKSDLVGNGDDPKERVGQSLGVSEDRVVLVSAKSGQGILDQLVPKIVHLAKGSDLALARTFPVLRRAVADRIVRRTAYENGLVGVAFFVPGADTPVLTLNQVRMIMRLASVYGEEISFERAKEILAVVGSGLVFRTVARSLVSMAPIVGWGIKGGVAYTGTVAMGKAAMKYFEGRQRSEQ